MSETTAPGAAEHLGLVQVEVWSRAVALLSTHSDRDGNTHIASFIPGEGKEGWR